MLGRGRLVTQQEMERLVVGAPVASAYASNQMPLFDGEPGENEYPVHVSGRIELKARIRASSWEEAVRAALDELPSLGEVSDIEVSAFEP